MGKSREQLKILYLQIREDEETKAEELREFSVYGGLKPEQFTIINVFDTPVFDAEQSMEYDSVWVGGSSDATVREPEKFNFMHSMAEMLKFCLEKDIPVLASCFGFQVAVEYMGGKVILDKQNMEMGTFDIDLTEAAKDDPILKDTPNPFIAVCGHKERAESIPEGVILLATSALCPYHAFKYPGDKFYAFQFHPEINTDDLVARITRYKERYFDRPDEQLAELKAEVRPSDEAQLIIKKFVDRILVIRTPFNGHCRTP